MKSYTIGQLAGTEGFQMFIRIDDKQMSKMLKTLPNGIEISKIGEIRITERYKPQPFQNNNSMEIIGNYWIVTFKNFAECVEWQKKYNNYINPDFVAGLSHSTNNVDGVTAMSYLKTHHKKAYNKLAGVKKLALA